MIYDYKIIGLCTGRVHDDESNRFITELNEQMVRRGYRLFVYGVCSDIFWNGPAEKGESYIFDLIDYSTLDGMIVYEEKLMNKDLVRDIIRKSLAQGIPTISIGNEVREEGCVNLSFDYEGGFEGVVRHIVEEHGVRDLHFIAGVKDNSFSEARKAVFQKVLKENGITFDESLVSYGDFWDVPVVTAVEKLIEEKRVPKAFICVNDSSAMVVNDVLAKHGYKVPGDILVTGFDGVDEIYFSSPKVTSCFCSYQDLSAKLIELLQKGMEHEPLENQYYSVPQLILSESCGCKQYDNISVWEHLSTIKGRFYNTQESNRTLVEISSKIHTSHTIEEVAKHLQNKEIGNMCCLINKDCIDDSIDPMQPRIGETFDETMCLILDTDDNHFPVPCDFERKEVAPGLKWQLMNGMPHIFVAIYYQERPLGYICFHYWSKSKDDFDKISQTVNAFNNAIGGFRNTRYQRFLVKHIEEMYQLDALTGLYNRISFMKKYEEMMQHYKAENRKFTVILADLDGLKGINDNFGHGEGDNAIRTTAKALKHVCPEDALCTRFGGDELFAVCRGELSEEEVKEALDAYLEAYNEKSGKPYRVSASVGVYVEDLTKIDDFEALLKKADIRMYRNKAIRKEMRR